jgi:biotin carboxyl carrier protein
MKMENELTADVAARVSAVHVAPGDAVERDQVLVELAALEEDAP